MTTANGEHAAGPQSIALAGDGGPFPAFAFGPAANARAAVAVLPALGTPARWYFRLAEALARDGCAVLVVEWRGVDSSPARAGRGADWNYAGLVDGEVDAAFRHLRAAHPGIACHALGHSMGGHAALLHAARADSFASVALVACGTPHWRAFGPATAWKVLLLGCLVRLSVATTGVWHGDRLGFGGRQPAGLMREWALLVRSGRLVTTRRDGAQELGPPHAAGVLALAMRGDTWSPPAAVRALLRIVAPDRVEEVVERLGGGAVPDHFTWLRDPGVVVARLSSAW